VSVILSNAKAVLNVVKELFLDEILRLRLRTLRGFFTPLRYVQNDRINNYKI